jgi:hypothetical protein
MDDKLITIAEYDQEFEAQFACNMLKASGVKAVVVGGNVKGLAYPEMSMMIVQLKVFEADAERGRQILAEAGNSTETTEDDNGLQG